MRLFHVSENPDIDAFVPREAPQTPEGRCVWAISERMLHNYLVPRDCPRVTFHAAAATCAEDRTLFMGNPAADFVIAVETAWLKRIREAVLYVYEFSPQNFRCRDEIAGYHISGRTEIPAGRTEIRNVMTELSDRGVELRPVADLRPLRDAIIASTLNFSCIRMRNAVPAA